MDTKPRMDAYNEAFEWTSSDNCTELHHYAKREVMELIIEHKQLRMSRYDKMRNDPEEGRFA